MNTAKNYINVEHNIKIIQFRTQTMKVLPRGRTGTKKLLAIYMNNLWAKRWVEILLGRKDMGKYADDLWGQ